MRRKTKILFVITYLELGGAQKQLLSALKGLSRDKYDIYLCAGNAGYLKKEFLKLSDINIKFIPTLIRTINPISDLISFIRLFFYIKKNRFNIVHTHSPKASILGRWAAYFAGVKNVVYTVHGWPFHRFMSPITYKFYLFLERLTARITSKIIVVSDEGHKTAVEKRIAPPEKITRVHYGIDIKDFDAVYTARGAASIGGPVMTISSFKPQKDILSFLKTAKELLRDRPELTFKVLGRGPMEDDAKDMIQALGLQDKVRLQGWVDNVADEFKDASMFVLPSLWEGLPVTLIEAAVSGVPFVVTGTDGVRDVVGDAKCGIVTEPGRPEEIEKACKDVLDNYPKWNEAIKSDRDKLDIGYWSVDRMMEDLNEMYESLFEVRSER